MSDVFQDLCALKPRLDQANRVWVGFSGGLDSTVLLYQLTQLGIKGLCALHVNHQLSVNAASWQRHCQAIANSLDCELSVQSVSVEVSGYGLEAAARTARYRAFAAVAEENDVFLTAHHANDQAETFLFRLLRGAGLKGLSAVNAEQEMSIDNKTLKLIRPFLAIERQQLLEYANVHQLRWVEDESNRDSHLDRNYIRREVLPRMQARWPQAIERITNSASLLAASEQLLDEYLANDLAVCQERAERLGHSIDLMLFKTFNWRRQQHVLRLWLHSHGYLLPEQKHLVEVRKLIHASEESAPEVAWGPMLGEGAGGCSLRRFRNRLYCLPRIDWNSWAGYSGVSWDARSSLALADACHLSAQPADTGLMAGIEYRVETRSGGERCRPEGRAKSQTLKKLLQEYGLENWLRDFVPLIYRGAELVAVGDLWICEGFSQPGGYRPQWVFTF